tara:strand:+ start:2241 stop:2864 length:624 start_codon:yes stop_codon:yes gene_type:complete
MKKSKKSKKRKRISNDDSDEDSDEEDSSTNDHIEVIDNHIYFYSDVSRKSVFILNRCFKKASQYVMNNNYHRDADKNFIYLHIFSDGGCVFSAFAIIDIINSSKIPVVSIIEGCAASSATMISVSCHKKLIRQSAFMLVHEISGGMIGKISEYKDELKNMESLMKRCRKIYKKNTGIDINTIKNKLKRDIWWSAKKCLKYGLVDEII